jgi:hypothetical protein
MVQTARQKKREENRALWAAREAERKKGKPTAAKRNPPAPAPAHKRKLEKSEIATASTVDKEIAKETAALANNTAPIEGKKRSVLPETIEGRARLIQKMISSRPNLAYGDVVEHCVTAWGVTEKEVRCYWTRAFERFKELGDLEPSATRGRLVDMAFDIAHANKTSDPNAALSAMRMVASLLGLDKLALERLSLDIQRYTRAMQIEEEKLRILGGGGDGPFLPDGFEDKMAAAAEKVLSRGTVIEGDVVPSGDGNEQNK